MSEKAWHAAMEHVLAMPEGHHIRARCGTATLLLERRADVLIALREISCTDADAAALAAQPPHGTDSPRWQLLRIGNSRFLCDWKRHPTHAAWLAVLASISL